MISNRNNGKWLYTPARWIWNQKLSTTTSKLLHNISPLPCTTAMTNTHSYSRLKQVLTRALVLPHTNSQTLQILVAGFVHTTPSYFPGNSKYICYNRGSDFCEFSCIRGHESWRKSKHLIFVNFQVHGVPSFYLIAQKWWLNRSKTKYKHFKGKKPVPWWPKNEPIKNLSPAVVVSGIKNLMLRVSLQSDHR